MVEHPVLYFDASGSITKKINGHKDPFLYSMVFHDVNKKQILPLYQFGTTCHATLNISKYNIIVKCL